MFNKVVIVGVGLLGGSLARDLRECKLAGKIIGVCRSAETAKVAIDAQVVDEILPIELAVKDADLIVMATPMQAMLALLKSVAKLVPESAVLTDVGSVKTDLYAKLKEQVPELLSRFVLAHPIAGGERSGVSASRTSLFQGKHVVITQTAEVPEQTVELVQHMWDSVGARVVRMSLQEHDAVFAKTSHLPHIVAFSLVNTLNSQSNQEQLFDMAAAGFYDFTRIASSDAEMWRDICITNRQQILLAIDQFSAQMQQIRKQIEQSDQAAISDFFDAAKTARNSGLIKKHNRNDADV